MTAIVRNLREAGFEGFLSIELFNREYWKRDPLEIARLGLKKMKQVVEPAV